MKHALLNINLVLLLLSSFSLQAEVLHIEKYDLLERMKTDPELVIIDIRDPQEFEDGHIKGAINIRHTEIIQNPDILDRYKDKHVVMLCRGGVRTVRTLEYIDTNKFKAIYHLQGDMIGWNNEDLPIIQ